LFSRKTVTQPKPSTGSTTNLLSPTNSRSSTADSHHQQQLVTEGRHNGVMPIHSPTDIHSSSGRSGSGHLDGAGSTHSPSDSGSVHSKSSSAQQAPRRSSSVDSSLPVISVSGSPKRSTSSSVDSAHIAQLVKGEVPTTATPWSFSQAASGHSESSSTLSSIDSAHLLPPVQEADKTRNGVPASESWQPGTSSAGSDHSIGSNAAYPGMNRGGGHPRA